MKTKQEKAAGKHPVIWMAAGAGLTFLIVAVVALVLLPGSLSEENAEPEQAAALTPSAETAAATGIPTFTPSITPTPSATPSITPTPSPSPTPTFTPTPTPTVTPSITPTSPPMVRAKEDTRIHSGPHTDYSEQGWLVEGQAALILSQLVGGDWWYIQTELGIKGWAPAEAVTTENDLSSIEKVTPYPLNPGASQPDPAADTPTPAPLIGDLLFDEVWPVSADCGGDFTLTVWMRAHGGVGIYTYLVNGEIVAENIVDGGATAQVVSIGNWQGTLSVISGDQRVDRDVLFSMADWCQE